MDRYGATFSPQTRQAAACFSSCTASSEAQSSGNASRIADDVTTAPLQVWTTGAQVIPSDALAHTPVFSDTAQFAFPVPATKHDQRELRCTPPDGKDCTCVDNGATGKSAKLADGVTKLAHPVQAAAAACGWDLRGE